MAVPVSSQALLKPLNPRINQDHPLAQNLVFDAAFSEGGSASTTFDTVTSKPGTLTNGANWVITPFGNAINFDNVDNIVNFTGLSNQNTIVELSLETMFYAIGYGEATAGGRIWTKGAAPRGFLTLNTVAGAGRETNAISFGIGGTGGDGQWYTPTNSVALNTWYHHVSTYSCTNLNNVPIMYLNGLVQTLTQLSLPVTGYDVDTSVLDIGNRAAGDRTFNGYILYFRIYNKILTSTDVRSLYVNPWQIYQKPRPKIFFLPGTAYTQTYSDTITISEPSFLRAFTKAPSEIVTPSDTLAKASTRSFLDTSTISDTFSYIQGRFQSLSDTITISDTLSYLQNRFKTFSETITISDTLTNSYVYIREYLDTSTVSDTFSSIRGFVLSDVMNIKDWLWRWHRAPQVLFSRVSLGASSFIKRTLGSSGWTEESPDVTVIDNDWS